MTTSVIFQQDKDPDDQAWYAITWPAPILAAVLSVTADPTQNDTGLGGIGIYSTPGDAEAGGPVLIDSPQLWASNASGAVSVVSPAPSPADSVAFRVSGGVPGSLYAIRAHVQAIDGSLIARTAILTVTGR